MEQIYLDANATTPVLPAVLQAMLPFLSGNFGNPSSAHAAGQRTRSAVERARTSLATLLACSSKEIVFTSGGTESNNLALAGVLQPFLDRREPAHLITTQIEHHAVLYAAESLERRGLEVTFLEPDADGVVQPVRVREALRPHTRMLSIMLANNETGALQPLAEAARCAKAHAQQHGTSLVVHTDAVQAAGKIPVDLTHELNGVDLLTISGHKMYAPQGTGALFVRKGVPLAPLFHGGPHERQRRAGTENVPGIVALGKAAELAREWLAISPPLAALWPPDALAALRDRLQVGLLAAIPGAHINAAAAPRVPNTLNLRVPGIDAEALLIALDMLGVATSFGAACQSGATEPSHVLLAMRLSAVEARSSLRLSLSRLTTNEEIDQALLLIPQAVARLRSLSAAGPA